MKRLAILLALLAMPAIVGCGSSSDGKTASASSKKKKPSQKTNKPKPGDTHPKGYKPPQKVWGPVMLEEYRENLKSSDAKTRLAGCVGLFNMRDGATEALPELKRLAKNDKDKKVRDAAKRAIKAIEEG